MYLAIDVGGTKTLLAVFDEQGAIVEQVKFPTPKAYDDFTDQLAAEIGKLSTKDFQACGMAIPGRIDRKNGIGVVFGNLPWENVPAAHDVEKMTNCPVILENDANLAGLSEALLVKDEFRKVLYVTVSTGIGTGIIIDGKIDPDYADSEPGHILLEYNGRLQYWEEFASGSAIVEKYGKRASEIDDPQIWYVVARNIAIGLNQLIAILTPEVIILGGGVGTHLDKFKDRLQEHLKMYENPMVPNPAIRKAGRPEEAVIYGCYEIVKAAYGKTAQKTTA